MATLPMVRRLRSGVRTVEERQDDPPSEEQHPLDRLRG